MVLKGWPLTNLANLPGICFLLAISSVIFDASMILAFAYDRVEMVAANATA